MELNGQNFPRSFELSSDSSAYYVRNGVFIEEKLHCSHSNCCRYGPLDSKSPATLMLFVNPNLSIPIGVFSDGQATTSDCRPVSHNRLSVVHFPNFSSETSDA